MTCTTSAMRGNVARAATVRRGSRTSITASSATMVPAWRTTWTSTVEDRRASRVTSFSIRDINSAECVPLKKARGIP